MISVQVDGDFEQVVDSAGLEQAAAHTLAYLKAEEHAGLTVVIGGDSQVQELNRQFLGHDHSTDVLSFPSGDIDPDEGEVYLGDIIISFPQALRQAKVGGHPVSAELMLLVVHGVLHLLGFDHDTQVDQDAMWKIQAEILQQLGNPVTGPIQES